MVNLANRSSTAGIPSQWNEDITSSDIALLTGDYPPPATRDHPVASGITLAAFSVVTLDTTTGNITPYTAAGGTKAYGVTVARTTGGDTIPVYFSGVFNPEALVWDVAVDTDAKKVAAFTGSPSPSQIILRRPKAATV